MASDYTINPKTKKAVLYHLIFTITVLVLLMLFGVLMLLNQGEIINLEWEMFYKLMSVHGIGMVGIATVGGIAIMFYFTSKYLKLNPKVLMTHLYLTITAYAGILVAVFVFNYSDAWTFLYPLPSTSAEQGTMIGVILFLGSVLLFGISCLIVHVHIARHIIGKYGGLRYGLGWNVIFGKDELGPPTAVVASTMVSIVNVTAIIAGGTAIIFAFLNIATGYDADPLLIKHLTYAFGHVFANATIYMGVIAVYEILARTANRPWKSNKVFLIFWNLSTILTLTVYTHHLFMDFSVPAWMLIGGQILSHLNGMPVLVVTAYGALMIVYKAKMKWDVASLFIFVAMFGWAAGAIPALIDATIVINQVMHNTKWVPGHFHTYMGIGIMAMIIGFIYYFSKYEGKRKEGTIDKITFVSYVLFFLGLAGTFLYAGKTSVPRRWAEHLPEWVLSSQLGAVAGALILTTTSIIFVRFIMNLSHIFKNTQLENN